MFLLITSMVAYYALLCFGLRLTYKTWTSAQIVEILMNWSLCIYYIYDEVQLWQAAFFMGIVVTEITFLQMFRYRPQVMSLMGNGSECCENPNQVILTPDFFERSSEDISVEFDIWRFGRIFLYGINLLSFGLFLNTHYPLNTKWVFYFLIGLTIVIIYGFFIRVEVARHFQMIFDNPPSQSHYSSIASTATAASTSSHQTQASHQAQSQTQGQAHNNNNNFEKTNFHNFQNFQHVKNNPNNAKNDMKNNNNNNMKNDHDIPDDFLKTNQNDARL